MGMIICVYANSENNEEINRLRGLYQIGDFQLHTYTIYIKYMSSLLGIHPKPHTALNILYICG